MGGIPMLVKLHHCLPFLTLCFVSSSLQNKGNELVAKDLSGSVSDSVLNPEVRRVLDSSRDLKELASPNGTIFKLGIYQHYKGPLYQVIGACKHTETGQELVYYRSLYGDYGFWVRPFSMFFENIEYEGQTLPRFKYIE